MLWSKRRRKKRKYDALRKQIHEQKLFYESEITRLEEHYKDEINRLEIELNKSAHEASPKSEEEEMKLSVSEVVAYVKERFSKSSAEEMSIMLYHFAGEHDCLTKKFFKLIDGIVPAIMHRDALHQTFSMPNIQQFNNNPRKVLNWFWKKKKGKGR